MKNLYAKQPKKKCEEKPNNSLEKVPIILGNELLFQHSKQTTTKKTHIRKYNDGFIIHFVTSAFFILSLYVLLCVDRERSLVMMRPYTEFITFSGYTYKSAFMHLCHLQLTYADETCST